MTRDFSARQLPFWVTMNRRLLSRLLFAVVIVATAAGFDGVRADAVPNLLPKSVPTINATVAEAPTQLDMFFSQKLTTPPVIFMEQTTPVGGTIPLDPPVQGKTADEWIYKILIPLSPGVYKEHLSGSVETTNVLTIVGTPVLTPNAIPATTVPRTTTAPKATTKTTPLATTVIAVAPGVTTTPTTSPKTAGKTDAIHTVAGGNSASAKLVGLLGRWLSYLGLSALFGGLMLIALSWHEGTEYVLTVRFFRLAWVAALAGSLLTLVSLTAIIRGTSVGQALGPSAWIDIKSHGEGVAAIARLLFVAGSAWVAFGPERAVAPASQLPAFAFPFLSLVTFGFSHTTGSKLVGLGVVANSLHVLGVAAWIGGLLLLSRVALTAPGGEDVLRAVRGFSRIAVLALLVVTGTGVVQVFRLVGGPTKLFSTNYGRVLLVKVVAVALLAYVATANRHVVRIRLARATAVGDRAAFRLRRSIAGEATIGMIVLGLSGLMMNLSPAGLKASVVTNGGIAPSEVVTFKQTGLDATVGIGPSVAGVYNTVRIAVRNPGTTNLISVNFKFFPVNGVGTPFAITPPVPELKNGAVFHFDKVPFDAAGTWVVIISGDTLTAHIPEISKTFTVQPAPGSAAGPAATAPPNSLATGST
jgi:copper transport protein